MPSFSLKMCTMRKWTMYDLAGNSENLWYFEVKQLYFQPGKAYITKKTLYYAGWCIFGTTDRTGSSEVWCRYGIVLTIS